MVEIDQAIYQTIMQLTYVKQPRQEMSTKWGMSTWGTRHEDRKCVPGGRELDKPAHGLGHLSGPGSAVD